MPYRPPCPEAPHRRRTDVFVAHGRDEQARRAVFAFLRAIGLRPLEWEHLVAITDTAAPSLNEVMLTVMPRIQAVVVLLTPEDVVRLHPELRAPGEAPQPREYMQARPNVLIELGMALALHPRRTVILTLGEQQPISDIAGLNYVRVTPQVEFRAKFANHLRAAGCPVDTSGEDWLHAGDFAALDAHRRTGSSPRATVAHGA